MTLINKRNSLKKAIIFLLIPLFLLFGGYYLGSKKSNNNSLPSTQELQKLAQSKEEIEINRAFEFPVSNNSGNEESITFKFNIISAKTNELITRQGEPFKAIEGKKFLLLTLELVNDSAKNLTVNSPDFIRLVDPDGKKFAPDFYNDPVLVPAEAVKRDDLGFIVPENDKQFLVLIGQADEQKEEVEINFK